MRRLVVVAAVAVLLGSCTPVKTDPRSLVVTYGLLGSVVKELVGDAADVRVIMPNGVDVHDWAPSAQDIETLDHAALIVRNGVQLEEGLGKALDRAAASGVPVFTVADHIAVRTVREGQGLPGGDPDQRAGAPDPHLWMDPLRLKTAELALADQIKTRFGADVSARAVDLAKRLEALDAEIKGKVAALPASRRQLVTGHESLGYWADAYGFILVGAIIPSLTDQAEVSAADMAALKKTIRRTGVHVIFTELGTPPKVAQTLGTELGVGVVEVTTHTLPPDGSYFTFQRNLTDSIVDALK